MTDGSVCPTLVLKALCFGGAGAFACQPFFFTLRFAAANRAATVTELLGTGYATLNRAAAGTREFRCHRKQRRTPIKACGK
jgi:hypothetical protein